MATDDAPNSFLQGLNWDAGLGHPKLNEDCGFPNTNTITTVEGGVGTSLV